MATYYTTSSNQRDAAAMMFIPGSYPEAPVLPGNLISYLNSGSYSDALAARSQQQSNCIEIQSDSLPLQQDILSNLGGSRAGEQSFNAWRDGRNEMLVTHPVLHGGPNSQGQGLFLSLGTEIPSGIQAPSILYQNPREEHSRIVECFPPGLSCGNQESNRGDLSPYGMTSIARIIPNSKYLKAAQQLIDEVVSVGKVLKQPDKEDNLSTNENGLNCLKEGEPNNEPSNLQESARNLSTELSHAERQELQNKLTKLVSMLDEVDSRYKQYYHQMQIVVSSFDVIAGHGAAKSYTALALQTISRHFRCLRDAISGQIQASRKSVGEQETSENSRGVGITRLRYVDQQLRQQRALQQLGMMQQHAWRPQRGLPDSSVSILRAWLFEHFLHPYPKDSDKIMLSKQTGLTRSQVSNWFINARVRLWKPMVEEMYKEEIGDAEMDSNSSSEYACKVTKGDPGPSEDRAEETQQSECSAATERCSAGQLMMDSKTDHVPDLQMAGSTARNNFQSGTRGETITGYGLRRIREEQRPCVDDCSLFHGAIVHPDGGGNGLVTAADVAYQMPEMGRFESGSGVSLTLGLQHCEAGSLPISNSTYHPFVSMRGGEIYGAAASSVGAETTDFECMNPGNRQHRFSSPHLLHDSVA